MSEATCGASAPTKTRISLRSSGLRLLGKFFKTGAAFWMNVQARYDLETAEDAFAPQIKKIASYGAV
jgi:plasmid maintenance system antidote protein VapI